MATGIAESGDIFDVIGENSYAMQWLEKIFPFVAEDGSGMMSGSAWQEAMWAFNGALMTIAIIFFSWNALSGVIDAARDGRPFQDKVHMAWGPLRAFGGIGLMAPIPGLGWSLAQAFVLLLGVMATSFGSYVWTTTVNAVVPKGEEDSVTQFLGKVNVTNSTDLAQQFIRKELCYRYLDEELQVNNTLSSVLQEVHGTINPVKMMFGSNTKAAPSSLPAVGPTFVDTGSGGAQVAKWDYGPICGKIQVDVREVETEDEWTGQGMFGQLTGQEENYGYAEQIMSARQTFDRNRAQAAANLLQRLRGAGNDDEDSYLEYLAEQGPEGFSDVDLKQFAGAIAVASDEYAADMKSAAKTFVGQRSAPAFQKFRDYTNQAGWASAGSTFLTLTQVSSEATRLANKDPQTTGMQNSSLPDEFVQDLDGLMKSVTAAVSMSARISQPSEDDIESMMSAESTLRGDIDVLGSLTDWVSDKLERQSEFETSGHPYSAMISYGHSMLNAGLTTATTSVGLFVAGQGTSSLMKDTTAGYIPFVGAGLGLSAGIAKAASWVILVGGSLVGAILAFLGVMHGYVLPLIPWVYFLFGVVAFVFSLVEGIFAVQAWALMSGKLEGDELLHQGQKTGLMIFFGVFLRPVLMILGLVAGFVAFNIVANFLNQTYQLATDVAMFGQNGIIAAFAIMILMTYLYWYVATRCLSLIHTLPSKVGQYMGVNIDDGNNGQGDSDKIYGIAAGTVTSSASTAAKGSAGGAGLQAAKGVSNKLGSEGTRLTRG